MTGHLPSATRAAPHFDLRIEDLIVDGFAPSQSRAIAAALEQELVRLLAFDGAPFVAKEARHVRPIAFDRIDAGVITLVPGASARLVGYSAARAIVQSLRTASAGNAAAPVRRNGS